MNGNRVLLYFQNFGRTADWWSKGVNDSKWPNNYDGTRMIDHAHLAVMAQVFVRDQHIPVTSFSELQSLDPQTQLDTLYYIPNSNIHHSC